MKGKFRWGHALISLFHFQQNGTAFNTNEMSVTLWSYKAMFGEN